MLPERLASLRLPTLTELIDPPTLIEPPVFIRATPGGAVAGVSNVAMSDLTPLRWCWSAGGCVAPPPPWPLRDDAVASAARAERV